MFIRVKDKANGKRTVQIVENQRRGDKIHQNIVRHVGIAENDREEQELRRLAESIIIETKNQQKPVLPIFAPEDIYGNAELAEVPEDETVQVKDLREEMRVVEGIGEVFGKLFNDLGFNTLIGETRRDEQWNEILKACVIARIANPQSKHRTAALLEEDYGIKIPLDRIYRMMDHLYPRVEEVKRCIGQSTLNLYDNKVDVLFFDVTTLYFESVERDELRENGFSKDAKFKEVQVVLALVVTNEGLPITYEVFPGNTYEGHTLIEVIEKMKQQYNIGKVILVADRALFNEENLKKMEDPAVGIQYVVAAKLKALPKKAQKEILTSEDYQPTEVSGDLHWVREWDHKGRRLIVSYSGDRAKKDAADRQRLIDRLMKKFKNGKCSLKSLIPNYGTKKYLNVKAEKVDLNQDKIDADGQWDGLHGVITNVSEENARTLLARYSGLWQIEAAFRVNKHDLKMRPIHHWTPERIEAHISICFIAYTLAKQALYRLKVQQKEEMSFERLRNELLHVQATICRDVHTQRMYKIPSRVTVLHEKIYRAFGLRRSAVPRIFKGK